MTIAKAKKRLKDTRKFGKKRFILVWDSATFSSTHDPNTKAAVLEKLRIARLWQEDYRERGYHTNKTTYNGGRDFKVWAVPR